MTGKNAPELLRTSKDDECKQRSSSRIHTESITLPEDSELDSPHFRVPPDAFLTVVHLIKRQEMSVLLSSSAE